MLIIRDLISGPRRFVELQRVLPGISTEQLRSRLNRMVADGMLTRKRYREVPPRVDYELTERARDLAPILGELARWGFDWAWGPPRSGEAIDIGAVFRLIPGLIKPGEMRSGTVELTVTDARDGAPMSYLVEVGTGAVSVTQGEGSSPADARIRGKVKAWVAALAPGGSRSGLRDTGDSELAMALLDRFALAADAPAAAVSSASA